jgi:hypothetical protein
MSTVSRPHASFGVNKKKVPAVLTRAQAMYNAMILNATMFVSPTITMAAFLALITALVLAQQNVTGTRAKGAATLRNTKRDALWTAMQSLQSYAQVLADAMTAENAAALIEAAGLVVAGTGTRTKAILTASLVAAPGTVHLEANRTVLVGKANAHKQVTFNWQWSTDGKTWTTASATPYASTEIPGLTPLSTYSFRVSVTIAKQPTGPWSQVLPTHLVEQLPAVELRALA